MHKHRAKHTQVRAFHGQIPGARPNPSAYVKHLPGLLFSAATLTLMALAGLISYVILT